jgi:riboflavin synthase
VADGPALRLAIAPALSGFTAELGASLSVDGVCLTLERIAGTVLYFTAVKETLSRSTLGTRRAGAVVNLERALLVSGRLDGHFVLGHVDAVGTIAFDKNDGIAVVRTIRIPTEISKFCAEKGSVALDGISLTITRVAATELDVSLVPFTISKTTMATKKPGDAVNVECDVLARYLDRLSSAGAREGATKPSLFDTLERSGF